ncbi:hypothetical protein [Teredinibacter purpureus]|uniref:hypothetical protein n=1 Tax=Teredinibacter purpureus TaxID=2731756 RepID=UPI0005F8235E|nr:hypothetical protein [Teredinibacter purpureus]
MVNVRNCLIAALIVTLPLKVLATEIQIGIGLTQNNIQSDTENELVDRGTENGSSEAISFAVRNQYKEKHLLGAGIDYSNINGDRYLGIRAIDYQYVILEHTRVGAFIGAASINSGLPQNGYYLGFHVTQTNIFNFFDAGIELRYGSGLARDRLLSTDPQGEKPDMFLDITSLGILLSKRF